MNLFPQVVPSADLLTQAAEVERGLKQRRRVGILGLIGLLLWATAQLLILFSTWTGQLSSQDWSELTARWWLYGSVAILIVLVLALRWAKYWQREIKTPFPFTIYVREFVTVGQADLPAELDWLARDLRNLLGSRIGRLTFLDETSASADQGPFEGHIHVAAEIGIRTDEDGRQAIEVMPRVRQGQAGNAETLAPSVRVRLHRQDSQGSLSTTTYQRLVERLYWSVATQVYFVLRSEIQRRIDLLPTRFLAAQSSCVEAQDYGHSRMLDGYNEGLDFFDRALEYYEPKTDDEADEYGDSGPVARLGPLARNARIRLLGGLRRSLARIVPRAGRAEILIAQAQVGASEMLLRQRVLSGMSGRTLTRTHRTALVRCNEAIARLEALPRMVPGRERTLLDARVVRAFALAEDEQMLAAEAELANVVRSHGGEHLRHALYQFVRARVTPSPAERRNYYHRALQLSPDDELARFALAVDRENFWRSRRLDAENLSRVVESYLDVLASNPGNLWAWANAGYAQWLLEGLDEQPPPPDADGLHREAEESFKRGREYRDIRPGVFVAELDLGLARIAAERGDIPRAYGHFADAYGAAMTTGLEHLGTQTTVGLEEYFFDRMNKEMLQRYSAYLARVEQAVQAGSSSESLAARVLAYVRYEYANACLAYAERTGDYGKRDEARRQYALAQKVALNDQFLLPTFKLIELSEREEPEPPDEALEIANRLARDQDDWVDVDLLRGRLLLGKAARCISDAEVHFPPSDTYDEAAAGVIDKEAAAEFQKLVSMGLSCLRRAGSWGTPSDSPSLWRGAERGAQRNLYPIWGLLLPAEKLHAVTGNLELTPFQRKALLAWVDACVEIVGKIAKKKLGHQLAAFCCDRGAADHEDLLATLAWTTGRLRTSMPDDFDYAMAAEQIAQVREAWLENDLEVHGPIEPDSARGRGRRRKRQTGPSETEPERSSDELLPLWLPYWIQSDPVSMPILQGVKDLATSSEFRREVFDNALAQPDISPWAALWLIEETADDPKMQDRAISKAAEVDEPRTRLSVIQDRIMGERQDWSWAKEILAPLIAELEAGPSGAADPPGDSGPVLSRAKASVWMCEAMLASSLGQRIGNLGKEDPLELLERWRLVAVNAPTSLPTDGTTLSSLWSALAGDGARAESMESRLLDACLTALAHAWHERLPLAPLVKAISILGSEATDWDHVLDWGSIVGSADTDPQLLLSRYWISTSLGRTGKVPVSESSSLTMAVARRDHDDLRSLTRDIQIRADAGFFPLAGDTPSVASALAADGEINQMRERLHRARGLRIPGVNIKGVSGLGLGTYEIQIRGETVLDGSLTPGDYLPVPDESETGAFTPAGLAQAFRPASSRPSGQESEDPDAATFDAFQIILMQLEEVIPTHLPLLLTLQWLQDEFDEWVRATPGESSGSTTLLPKLWAAMRQLLTHQPDWVVPTSDVLFVHVFGNGTALDTRALAESIRPLGTPRHPASTGAPPTRKVAAHE
jgi:hypothetical protein